MVAIGIVLIAAVLIITRVNSIMDYPKDGATDTGNKTSVSDLRELNDDPKKSDTATSEGAVSASGTTNGNNSGNSSATGKVEFTIKIGQPTATTAAELEKAGLVTSAEAFITAVQAKNAEMSILAGTFEIPRESTIDEIIEILSN
jgi:hypothetical protein